MFYVWSLSDRPTVGGGVGGLIKTHPLQLLSLLAIKMTLPAFLLLPSLSLENSNVKEKRTYGA